MTMKTALFSKHQDAGAKIVDFFGWEMPIQYQSIVKEHQSVRQQVGVFDVSHMGRIDVVGPDAEAFLDYLATNQISGKPSKLAVYTVLCRPDGTCVDDVIVFRRDDTRFFVIANASNREKDLKHLIEHKNSFNVTIQQRFEDQGILAIQGPQAFSIVKQLFPDIQSLKPMHFWEGMYQGVPVIVSATGYTGSGGVEIYASNPLIVDIWEQLMKLGVQPIGLGARDTLRLEMGYALYGHELSDDIRASETVSAWTIKKSKSDFLGKEALDKLERDSVKRYAVGIEMTESGIPREGYDVIYHDKIIGKVTSGTFSPILQKGIALLLIDKQLKPGEVVGVQIRGKTCQGEVVTLPFYKN